MMATMVNPNAAISDQERDEFVSILRDWRLAYGALRALKLDFAMQIRAEEIEEQRRALLLEFLDRPGIDVAFDAVISQRRVLAGATAPEDKQ